MLLAGTLFVCILILYFGLKLLISTHLKSREALPFKAHVQYVSIDGAEIAYYERGEGPPLLIIEGFGMSMADWDPALLRDLARVRKVIVYDLRRVGLSGGGVQDLSIQNMADDSFALLDELHIKRADVLGWSMGSLIAQEMVLTHPERIDRLILVSTLPGGVHTIGASPEISESVQNHLSGTWDDLLPFLFTEDISGKKIAEAYIVRRDEAVKSGESPTTPGVDVDVKITQEGAMAQMASTDRLERLSRITSKTLILAGEKDMLVPAENGNMVAASIPGSNLKHFPDSGHALLFMNSRNVTTAITDFLH